ncbi:hypothetical protein [Leeia oryzae]|nr:hypothetical protein [Leeia oryzae]
MKTVTAVTANAREAYLKALLILVSSAFGALAISSMIMGLHHFF